MQTVRRSLLDLSAMAAAAAPLERQLREAQAGLAGLDGDAAGLVKALGPHAHADLRHPLARRLAGPAALPARRDREIEERAMLALFERERPFARSARDFADVLCAANACAVPDAGLRQHEAGLPVTVGAIQILFPAPAELRTRLGALHGFVADQGASLHTAIAALAAILNAHPFGDGNGRMARALYGHLLGQLGLRGYFPFAAVFHASCGVFELCLREGEVRRNWRPFLRYNARILSLAAVHGCPALQE